MRALRLSAIVCGLTLACFGGATGSAGATPSATVTTVVSGLDNPRDLAFSPDGGLYVAEAGHGGNPADCIPGGPEGALCPGFTSGISVVNIAAGTSQRIVDGLASVSGEGGFAALGLHGISFLGNGTLYGIIGLASDVVPGGAWSPELTAGLKAQLGRLIQANPSGHWKTVADVGHANFEWTEENQGLEPGDFPDSNPYAVLAAPGEQWVLDAGANTISRVRPNGTVSIEKFIPSDTLIGDAVPTCIDRGPDGALYIGQLTAALNPPGSASIWRFDPATGALTQWASGLTTVTGCGFGKDGQFYAAEFSTLGLIAGAPGTGAVVRVPPHSTSPVVVVGGLSFPGGFAAGPDGSLYVSTWIVAPAATGLGSVVRITP
jgi:hypothetical protein